MKLTHAGGSRPSRTVEPGGAYLSGGAARIIYPNNTNETPGTRMDFWNYDPDGKGWYVYGKGTVTPDGKQVVPDPGVVIYELTGAMVASPDFAPSSGPAPNVGGMVAAIEGIGDLGTTPGFGAGLAALISQAFAGLRNPALVNATAVDGEPVDLGTGLFVMNKTDLTLGGFLPISINRVYRQNDTRSRVFGIGTTHAYEMFLVGDVWPYTYQDLILPDGGRVHFTRISPGAGWGDAVYEHTGRENDSTGLYTIGHATTARPLAGSSAKVRSASRPEIQIPMSMFRTGRQRGWMRSASVLILADRECDTALTRSYPTPSLLVSPATTADHVGPRAAGNAQHGPDIPEHASSSGLMGCSARRSRSLLGISTNAVVVALR